MTAFISKITVMPIPAAIKILEHMPSNTELHQMAAGLAGLWAPRDINLAWSSVTHSKLDDTTKQVLYNHLWG